MLVPMPQRMAWSLLASWAWRAFGVLAWHSRNYASPPGCTPETQEDPLTSLQKNGSEPRQSAQTWQGSSAPAEVARGQRYELFDKLWALHALGHPEETASGVFDIWENETLTWGMVNLNKRDEALQRLDTRGAILAKDIHVTITPGLGALLASDAAHHASHDVDLSRQASLFPDDRGVHGSYNQVTEQTSNVGLVKTATGGALFQTMRGPLHKEPSLGQIIMNVKAANKAREKAEKHARARGRARAAKEEGIDESGLRAKHQRASGSAKHLPVLASVPEVEESFISSSCVAHPESTEKARGGTPVVKRD
ncbi:hypothetical protein C8Q79DRAFT_930550 [Trametes meyenii]|nr:hypothetical protein C8Q79DRAFT_930550 [Trametes meyenii]